MNIRLLPHFVIDWNAAARRYVIVADGLTYAAARDLRDRMRAAGNGLAQCLSVRRLAEFQ